ncbi:MAG: class I SAM-dependent methyltransferase, partial [Bryobacteraceae bacterium]
DWERPLMEAMAGIVSETPGDILEVGFGLGISATYIQEHNVRSHTIIECNNDVLARARRWMENYKDRDIHLVQGKWQDATAGLGAFDGVFFDTYPTDEEEYRRAVIESVTFAGDFFPVAAQLLRPGGIFTYYTNEIDSFSRRHQRLLFRWFRSCTLSIVKPLRPPDDCSYWWADSMVAVKAIK